MRRSTARLLAFVILALLGAPVAMHVVMHDLHESHENKALNSHGECDHSDHEHPIVFSDTPQVSNLGRAALPLVLVIAPAPTTWTRIASTHRNQVSFGALRMDDDVGPQSLLSTFLI